MTKTLKEIAEEFNVKLKGYGDYSNFYNVTTRTIYLGINESEYQDAIIFFHELGHAVSQKKHYTSVGLYLKEVEAWKIGFELAEKYGLEITEYAHKFKAKCLKTYEDYMLNEHKSNIPIKL